MKVTERNPGAKGVGKSVVPKENHTIFTLSDLGITKKQSSNAQFLAEVPDNISHFMASK